VNANAEVLKAIQAITASHPTSAVTHEGDGQGGAWVTVDPVYIGDEWAPSSTAITFRIDRLTPAVDVYPHYVPADLHRKDGGDLGLGIHQNQRRGLDNALAVMISRSTPDHNAQNTPAVKLEKVLEWMRSR